jgi:hypothetical protein
MRLFRESCACLIRTGEKRFPASEGAAKCPSGYTHRTTQPRPIPPCVIIEKVTELRHVIRADLRIGSVRGSKH